ncbi:MAG: response regulator [Planctomycetota bacterium]|jgi:two-component system phosphate regulon response regulator PhoB
MSEWVPILVIDDDELVRREFKRSLELYGFKVYQAKNGQTGLRLAQEKRPAFILLDWMMPGMDGLEVLAKLKHNRKTENIPVFMLTGRDCIDDLDQAFEIGADGYIAKPSDLMDLGRIVAHRWENYTSQAHVR